MTFRHARAFAVFLTLTLASRAAIGNDSFGLGNGSNGPLIVMFGQTLVINTYSLLTAPASSGDLTLSVSSSVGIANGHLIMIWRPAGFTGPASSGNQTPIDLSSSNTGMWELARVVSVTPTSVLLTAPLQNSYSGFHTQVVTVPEYTTVNVPATGTIQAAPWDGATGGIVAFLANSAVSVGGVITANGAGFQGVSTQADNASINCGSTDNLSVASGGSFRGENITSLNFPSDMASGRGNIANGGGGGNCSQSGGGGGGNGGLGGQGGSAPGPTSGGLGGTSLTYSFMDHITFGGAGGHGQTKQSNGAAGASGGGAIYIRALSLSGSGSIAANGAQPSAPPGVGADGQGGGGAGGSIAVRLSGASAICGAVHADGGNGGSSPAASVGGGGGGAGGLIFIQATNVCSGASVAGGSGGTSNGSPSGAVGAAGVRQPAPPGPYCTSNSLCQSFNPAKPVCSLTTNSCVACPTVIATASGSATICPGGSTMINGSGGTSCSWSPSIGLSDAASCTPLATPMSTTTYTLTVTDANGCTSTNNPTATVTVGGTTATTGTVVSDVSSRPANGYSKATITVTLSDGSGCPVAGKSVTLSAESGSPAITAVSPTSDASGTAVFTVNDANVETVTFQASDVADGLVLLQTPTISFTAVRTLTWTGAASSTWSTASNWSPNGTPSEGDVLSFPTSEANNSNTNDLSALNLTSITFAGGAYTLSGNGIGLSGGITNSNFGNVLNFPITVLANQTISTSSGIVTFGGPINVGSFTLAFYGSFDVQNGFAGSGTITLAAGSLDIGGASTFSGTIVNPCCSFLRLNGATLPNATVNTGFLLGNGSVGAVTVTDFLAPGPNAAPAATLNGSGHVSTGNFSTHGLVYFDIQGGTPATGTTGYDQIDVTGTVTIDPSTQLNLALGNYSPTVGQQFILINNDGSDPISGTFNGKPDGSVITLGGVYQFQLNYNGGTGNDLTLTCTSAPKVWTGAVDNLWSHGENWNGGVAPVSGDRLEFPASAANMTNFNDISGLSLSSITFNGGPYRISGSAVTLSKGLTNSSFGNTVALPIQLTTSLTFNNGAGIVAFSAPVSVGTFALTLSGSFEFTGGFSGSGTISMTGGATGIGGSSGFSGTIFNSPCCNFLRINGGALPFATISSQGFVIGNGTVGALTTDAIVAPGPNDAAVTALNGSGVLHTGNWTTTAGNIYFDIQGPTPSTGTNGYDQIDVTGTVTIAPSTQLTLSLGGFSPTVGEQFVLINNDGSDPINGTFSGMPNGTIITLLGVYQFQLAYNGGTGNDVTLTCTSAPKVWSGAIDGLWSNGGNWVGGVGPIAGDRIEFPSPATAEENSTNDLSGLTLTSIAFNGPGYIVDGNSVAVSGGITNSSFGNSLRLPIQLTAAQTFNNSAGTLIFESPLDVQTFGVTLIGSFAFNGGFAGSGTISMSGGETFVGGTSTFSGTIVNSPCCNFLRLNDANLPSATVTSQGFVIGSGTVGALTTDAIVAPGPGGAGVMTLNGSGVLNTGNWMTTGGNVYIDLQGPTPTTGTNGYDQINVTGTVTLHPSTQLTLSLAGAFVPTIGQSFIIINNDGADSINGTFSGKPGGTTIVAGGQQFRIDYDGGTGNDVTLTALTGKLATTVTLGSSSNPSFSGQVVTFTATVTSGATGTVTFKDGVTTLGTGVISGTTATYMIAMLPAGTHSITAVYGGDASYGDATSAPLIQKVNPLDVPSSVSATAASITQVNVSWSAVANATGYEVWRSSLNAAYALVGSTTTATSLSDTLNIQANTTYLYKVRALSAGSPSDFSAIDPATTIIFTEPDLTGITIKSAHITELQTAVNAIRAAAALSAVTFTDLSLPANRTIRASHITELRTALDAAITKLGLPLVTYTDATITANVTPIRRAHITDLRGGVQ